MPNFARHKLIATVPSLNYTFENSGGQVTVNEAWSQFIRAELTCAAPDAATLELLDPREGVRVNVELRQDFGDWFTIREVNEEFAGQTIADLNAQYAGKTFADFNATHIHQWNSYGYTASTVASFDLQLRSRAVNHADGTMTVELASDEALLQSHALVATEPVTVAGNTVAAAVTYVLNILGFTLEPDFENATIATEDLESFVWQPGVTAWDFLTTLLQKGNLRLWCDGERKWHLGSSFATVPGLVSLSANNNVTAGTDTIDLDGTWYDAVVIKYSWTTEVVDGDTTTTVDNVKYDTAGDYLATKVLTLEYDKAYPGPGAAAGVLQRSGGRGRVLDVTSISDYSVTPGKAITISLPDIEAQTGFVSAVTWRFPDDAMSVTTRGLIDTPTSAWIFLPAGEAWADSPVGGSWADETIGA